VKHATTRSQRRSTKLFPRAILLQWHLNRNPVRRSIRSGRNPKAKCPFVPELEMVKKL
jgi:hypothetical protein